MKDKKFHAITADFIDPKLHDTVEFVPPWNGLWKVIVLLTLWLSIFVSVAGEEPDDVIRGLTYATALVGLCGAIEALIKLGKRRGW